MKQKKLWLLLSSGVLSLALIIGLYVLYKNQLNQATQGAVQASEHLDQAAKKALSGETKKKKSVTAPELSLTNNLGETVTLSELKGKVVMINFWASWCHYCRQEFPAIQKFYDQHKNEEDFYFLSINATTARDSKEAADEMMKSMGLTMPYAYDEAGEAIKRYQIGSFPTTFVVNKDGEIVNGQLGAVGESELEHLLAYGRAN